MPIVEGSIVRAGARVRIIAKLITGVTGEVIWTQSFDGELRDAQALPNEVARTITRKVDITPTLQSRRALRVHGLSIQTYIGKCSWAATTPLEEVRKD